MKSKNKTTEARSRINEGQRKDARKRLWMRLAAIFIMIAFLAGECSTMILMD